MLQNAYFLAKIGADTAETSNILPKFCQKLATTLRACGSAGDFCLDWGGRSYRGKSAAERWKDGDQGRSSNHDAPVQQDRGGGLVKIKLKIKSKI